MIIVDPVKLGDVAFARASAKSVFDRTGTLVQVPADTLAVTYDPADLSKAPYALVEAASTNLARYSEELDNAAWTAWQSTLTANVALAPNGTLTADKLVENATLNSHTREQAYAFTAGVTYTFSMFIAAAERKKAVLRLKPDAFGVELGGDFDLTTGAATAVAGAAAGMQYVGGGFYRCWVTAKATVSAAAGMWVGTMNDAGTVLYQGDGASGVLVWGAQLEVGVTPTSYIKTVAAAATRAADVIGTTAGLVYSNVAEPEPLYSAATSYAKDALVRDAEHTVYMSLLAANQGNALTDATKWNKRGASNRWAMLDQYNNTQTSNVDEITLVVSPRAIAQGVYLGNMLAEEVRISVVDQVEGLVYTEVRSLTIATSGSSFYNWCFKRIKRKDYFLTLKLPPYANPLVTINVRRIGASAKVGMCALGPVEDFGPTLLGLSAEGKDYSSTTFAFDGTSSTTIRPYAKRMTCDVVVQNDQIDYVQARLFDFRQKPLVWVGGPYGTTAVYGRYGSFRIVIQYQMQSLMNLTIEGGV